MLGDNGYTHEAVLIWTDVRTYRTEIILIVYLVFRAAP